jgi:two-component system NarL family response regulator
MPDTVPEVPIRVFLLIENRLLREALCRLFRKRSEFQIAGQCGQKDLNPTDLLDARFDVLAIDFFDRAWLPAYLPSGESTGQKFRAILIGMDEDSEQFLEAVRNGFTGYLLKDASAADVLAAIRSAFKGEAICPPRLCATLFRSFAQTAPQKQKGPALTARDLTLRQLQLVRLMAEGLTNKEIAAQLNLSEYTVRNHVHRILKQADVGSRHEAVDVIRAHIHHPAL